MLPLPLPCLASLGMLWAAKCEGDTNSQSVADSLCHYCSVLRVAQSANFSVNTSDAKSNTERRSHLQMNVATAIAPLGQPGHAALVTHEADTN